MFQIFRDTRALSFGAVMQTPGLDFKKSVSRRGGRLEPIRADALSAVNMLRRSM